MKSVLFYVLLFMPLLSKSQTLDSALFEFKSKLLTVSRFGVESSALQIVDELQAQKLSYIPVPMSNVVFCKIGFDQKFRSMVSKSHSQWIGSCYYYLAFNINKSTFYRMGGFFSEDIDDFFEDLTPYEYGQIVSLVMQDNEIDFQCLLQYTNLSRRQKKRKGFSCFEKCEDRLSTVMRVH